MHTGSGDHGGERDLAVCNVEVKLVAAPRGFMPFAVGLDADTTGLGDVGQHLRCGGLTVQLFLQTRACQGESLSGGETSKGLSAAAGGFLRGGGRSLGEAFASFDGGGIAGDVADDAAFLSGSNQGFVSLLTELGLGEFGESPREAGLMGNATSTGVTAEAPEGLIGVQFGDKLAGVRAIKDALGEEGVGQSEARVGRRGGRFRARGGGKVRPGRDERIARGARIRYAPEGWLEWNESVLAF